MARPAFIFCDTDAVIQFLLTGEVRPFRVLRSNYSIQPLVVPEVEIELRSNQRFGARIAPELKRALEHNLLRVVDKSVLEAHYGSSLGASMAATAALGQIASVGRQNLARADSGEAYTHAAALTMGVPSMSNDITALKTLVAAGLPVPATVLRPFDLISLCFQVNEMTEHDCDQFRATLIKENEHVPSCFLHASFGDGLTNFVPRICDLRHAAVGATGGPSLPYSTVVDL